MTAENLQKMKYLKACQQESMRIWPIASALSRKTQEDMVLSGYHIPKGTIVTRQGRNNDEEFYPQADTFIPERWIRGCPMHSTADPFTNLPFGHGARSCVGQRFARLELYIIAFKVIQKFRLEYHHEPIEVDYTGLGHPDRDCKIRLIPRHCPN